MSYISQLRAMCKNRLSLTGYEVNKRVYTNDGGRILRALVAENKDCYDVKYETTRLNRKIKFWRLKKEFRK